MRIEFVLSVQDLKKIQKHQKAVMRKTFSLNASFWARLLWALGMLVWVIPTILFVANLPRGMGPWLLYIALFPIGIWILLTHLGKRKYYRVAEPSFPPGLTRSVTITDNGLETSAGQSNNFTPWRTVMELVEAPDYILFILPLFASVAVPTRSFSDSNQLTAFVDKARNKMDRGTNSDEQ